MLINVYFVIFEWILFVCLMFGIWVGKCIRVLFIVEVSFFVNFLGVIRLFFLIKMVCGEV